MLVPVYGMDDAGNAVFVVTLQWCILLKTLLVRLVGINPAIFEPGVSDDEPENHTRQKTKQLSYG